MSESRVKSPLHPEILPLRQVPRGEGGGKTAGLVQLARLGLPVPRALVVLNASPENLPENIETAWSEAGGGSAAVRSSGSAEDGAEASAAGQYESYLNVPPEGVEQAVRNCLASAGSERAEAYEQGLSGTGTSAMAVIIQKMVNPSRAGVIFTADPANGDASLMIIEAVAGLGEALVSGHAEAARYVINAADGRVVESSGDLEGAALDKHILAELRAGAARAAADWGIPLDLEWAVEEGSGQLRWLQARPITALADSLDSVIDENTIVTRCNIGEMMPGAVTALTLSTVGRCLSTGLAIFYRSFGAVSRKEPDPPFFESFQDQLFMNLSSMYKLAFRVAGASVEATELSILGYVLPPHQAGKPASPLLRLFNGVRYMVSLLGWKQALRKLEKLARGFRIPTEFRSAAEIYQDMLLAQGPVLDRAAGYHYQASGFSGAMNAALTITLSGGNTRVSDEAKALITRLLSGVEGVESAAVLEGLSELADMIRGSAAEKLLDCSDAMSIHNTLLTDDSPIGIFYRNFMERHGFRCIREAELREPEWALHPEHLIDSLKALVDGPVRKTVPEPAVNIPELKLPQGVNPRAAAWLTRQARKGVRGREKSKYLLILTIHRFKLAARALAAALETEGLLPEADLAYFLTMEELGELLKGRGEGLIGRSRRRRRRFPQRQELRFPDISWGRPEPEAAPIPEGGSCFKGTPVSQGIAEGIVRVVKDRKDAEKLKPGEIMVARFTDIRCCPGVRTASGGWSQRSLQFS
ncbi:MAG: hypothetical protein CSA76_02130 [Spirochaetales bacterium]|nr:MAG: hypothetical protein CSA76_02130 [Spirochaetales bacterium]